MFGPEAKTRVWLVLDGKTLHVDRNGNGDLTEDGEKIAPIKGLEIFGKEDNYVYNVDAIPDGPRTHKNLSLSVRKLDYLAQHDEDMKKWTPQAPQGRGYALSVEVDMRGYQKEELAARIPHSVQAWDEAGFLVFADKPQSAPIVHLGGPRRIHCDTSSRLMVDYETDLMLTLQTPGLGAGTTAYLGYTNVVPQNVYPRVEITYPSAKPGEPPLKCHYELKERC